MSRCVREISTGAWHRRFVGGEVCMQGAVMLKMMKLTGSEEVVLSGWRVKSALRYKG